MAPFVCTKCGACCMDVRGLPGLKPGADGKRCESLTPELLCSVYETRPNICQVNKNKPAGMTAPAWHAINTAACELLQEARS